MKKLIFILPLLVAACGGHIDSTTDAQRANITNSPYYRFYDEEKKVYCWGNSNTVFCIPEWQLSR